MLINDLAEIIDLNGTWEFALGEDGDRGTIEVPGCWEAQGYSRFIDGPARYRRSVFIPEEWAGKRVQLEFEAVSYDCAVRCNGVEVGQHRGLWTPFALDVTGTVRLGEDNLLELEVVKPGACPGDQPDDRFPLRTCLAGFLPDIATSFGGIWQPARLRALAAGLTDVQIIADYDKRSVRIQAGAEVGTLLSRPAWRVEVYHQNQLQAELHLPFLPGDKLNADLPVPNARDWSPEQPALYTVRLALLDGEDIAAQAQRRTGFRRLTADGPRLLLNGQPVMLRGILSWGWEPERTAPTYTLEQARAEMRRARALGFNLIKLCLFVPNPAFFEAADEEGMLLWEELPMWLPEVTDDLRARAPVEYAEITRGLAHHPAAVLYSLGCEMNRAVDARLLAQLDQAVRGSVRDVLVCDNSGSGESYGGLTFDLADFTDYHPYFDLHYFEPLLDHWRRDWQPPRPWILGEFCDSDTFRDIDEIIQANGGERPWWLTRDNPVMTWRAEGQATLEWHERVARANPGFMVEQIVEVSHQQSFVVRKFTLEALRRRAGMGGYVITGLRDTAISTSGVWDDLGRAKWDAAQFQSINSEAILCLDTARRRTWRYGGDRPDPLDPHNFWSGQSAEWRVIVHDTGAGWPAGSRLDWSLSGPGVPPRAGSARLEQAIAPGRPAEAGAIQVSLPHVDRAVELTLEARVTVSGREVVNRWPVWVYPRLDPPRNLVVYDPTGALFDAGDWLPALPRGAVNKPRPSRSRGPKQIMVATAAEEGLWEWIAAGGRVVLLQQGIDPLPVRRCPFWREAIKLFADHPLWEAFPQQGFTGLQFYGMASDLAFDSARLAGGLPPGAQIRPILRRLDAREFHMSEYLFEARIGEGLLLACALRLQGGAGNQPYGWNRNAAGAAMLQALVRYAERAG